MRLATLALVVSGLLAGCNDLRQFQGAWRGPRVGDSPVLRVGVTAAATAALSIDELGAHAIRGKLTVEGLVTGADIVSLDGAEADVLAGMSFGGSPMRVYLSFVAIPDGGGEALAVIALYDDRRIEVRVLRGGTQPVYAIFALTDSGSGP